MEYRILGPVEAVADGRPVQLGGPLERALLARLLVDAGRAVSPAQLVEDLWEGDPPDSAQVSVRVRVSRLRKVLASHGAGDVLRTEAVGYVVRLRETDCLDALHFEERARSGRAALAAGRPGEAAALLAEGLGLWRGAALGGVGEAPFAQREAARLEEERLGALGDRIESRLAMGEHADLIAELDTLCARHPLHERLWAQRMLALYRCGRQADALAVYRQLRTLLSEELGIDPSPEVCALEARILHQDPGLAPVAARAPSASSAPSGLPTGVVTFLLTDIEGSTQLWEKADDVMASVLAHHDELITASVEAHGGCVIKSKGEGDSTLSVFRRASDAVAAALDVDRNLAAATWPNGLDLPVRIALHTGEAHERDGDFFGPAVNRAARVRSLASGGQIVLSRVTADVVSDHLPEGVGLRDLGEHEIRGSARSERVYELVPAVADERQGSEPTPVRPQLPEAIELVATGPFVGRDAHLEQLAALVEAAAKGAARTVFISGEPGIGKTRLAAELGARAYERGAIVLYGRSDEDSVFPYQPFIEALRQYVAAIPPARRGDVPGAADLAHLLPELGPSRLGGATAEDAEAARYRLFDAVAATLADAARSAPVVLVLDDLHWADRPTLLLLRHILRVGRGTPVLTVGTYRESDLGRTRPFAEMLADLRRERAFERIALRGLKEEEVLRLLEQAADHDVGRRGRALAHALTETTEGNPFFMVQILGHLIETERIRLVSGRWVLEERVEDLSIPEGVLEAVGRRLSRLSEACNRTLGSASVLGRTFETDVLGRMMNVDPDSVLSAVEEALKAGLVHELPDRARPACMFTHALVQQALYEELTLARKQRLHLKAADAIETVHASDLAAHVPVLALHLRAAGVAADPARVITCSVRATQQAWHLFAYEEAMEHGKAALELMDEHGVESSVRARHLERLGDLQFLAGADFDRGMAHLEEALRLYEAHDTRDRAIRIHAKLGRNLSWFWNVMDIPRAKSHLRQAERLLGPSADPEVAGFTARGLGTVALYDIDQELLADCAGRCMELGRQMPSDVLWATGASHQGHWLLCSGRMDDGFALLDEAWHVADRIDHLGAAFAATWIAGGWAARLDSAQGLRIIQRELDKPRQAQASNTRATLISVKHTSLVHAGRLEEARQLEVESDRVLRLPATWGDEVYLHDPRTAERSVRARLAHYQGCGNLIAVTGTLQMLASLLTFRGVFDEARSIYEESIALTSGRQMFSGELLSRAYCAVLEVEAGRLDDARRHVERCEEIVARGNGLRTYLAAHLMARGAVAATEARLAEANRHFAEAVEINRRTGHPWFAAEALHNWGRALIAADDRAEASERLDSALEVYASMGVGSPWTDRVVADRRRAAG